MSRSTPKIIFYTNISGNNLENCLRAQFDTTATAHTSGDAVTCATIIVNDIGHGCNDNDFVTLSGAVTLGDQITADILNQEYQVEFMSRMMTPITLRLARYRPFRLSRCLAVLNITPVFATTSDSGNGGAAVVGAYQINTGLDTAVVGAGWGAGTWSRGAWGSAANLLAQGSELRIWSHDNFGEDLLFNVRDGGIYYWDKSNGTSTRGVSLDVFGRLKLCAYR
jgi:hypothetical protein